jgi:hypothetical protein
MNKKIVQNIAHFLAVFVIITVSVIGVSLLQSDTCYSKEDAQKKASFEVLFLDEGEDTKLGEVRVAPGEAGVQEFRFADLNLTQGRATERMSEIVKIVVRFLQYVFGGIGVVYVIIAGYRLLVAGGQVEEQATKQKHNLLWIGIGFAVMTIADVAVNRVFFPQAATGEVQEGFLTPGQEQVTIAAAKQGVVLLRGVIDFFVAFVGTVAVLTIVLSGMRMVLSPGNDEVISSQKKIFMWAVIGLVIITLSDRLVNIFYGESGQRGIDVQSGLVELAGLTNYILGFMGIVAAASLIYAGVLMIANYGNQEAVSKAKTVVRDVLIGVVIAFSAYTIVSAIVRIAT